MEIKPKQVHIAIYVVITIAIAISSWQTYQRWLNPLGLKPEANPKQHDGSQEFQGLRDWESSIEPAPDEEGVRRYLDPWKLHNHGKEEDNTATPQILEEE